MIKAREKRPIRGADAEMVQDGLRDTTSFEWPKEVKRPTIPEGADVCLRRELLGLGDFIQVLGAAQSLREHRQDIKSISLVGPKVVWEVARHAPGNFHLYEQGAVVDKSQTIFMGPNCPAGDVEIALAPTPTVNRLEIFCKFLNVPVKIPQLKITPEERAKAHQWCRDKTGVNNPIVLVYRSSERWKDYYDPKGLHQRLARSYPVVTLENRKTKSTLPEPNTFGMSIRETMAIVNQARIVITPDTGWLHVAGCLKRPIFGLFGAQDPRFRQSLYGVPGGFLSGPCPYGKQPCWYSLCVDKKDNPPCMKLSVDIVASLILDSLALLDYCENEKE